MQSMISAFFAISRYLGIFTLLGVGITSAADLKIQSPVDYQVHQRFDRDLGVVRLQGRSDVLDGQVQYRILGNDFSNNPADERWRDLPTPLQKGGFDVQVTLPAGGWYILELRVLREGRTEATAVVPHVGVGEVFVVAGQSNAANHGAQKQQSSTGRLTVLDGKKWILSVDPQVGASGTGGSFMPLFGDAIVAKFNVPVGLVALAQGSTSVREWLPEGIPFLERTTTGKGIREVGNGQWESDGLLYKQLVSRLATLGLGGARAVLWHQGESDAGQERAGYPSDRQITGKQYHRFLESLIESTRRQVGWQLPWFTAQATYHSETDSSDESFREAQKQTWVTGIALQGPDTDTLGAAFRDGVHFNGVGLRKHAELWFEKISPWLDETLNRQLAKEGPPSSDYKIVWQDEFAGTELDSKKWKHRYPGPRKNGVNDPSAITLDGEGHLVITCSRKEDKILTGMISSDRLFSTKFGYFEARVRFQTQEGWWPGFWLMADNVANPEKGKGAIDDTANNGTEIDVFEYLRIRGDQIQHALHWNGYGNLHRHTGVHPNIPNLTNGYHNIGCEWQPGGYRFFVDGRLTWETTEAISQIPEYIILSGEVSDWPGNISRANLPDTVSFDYVRVWQKP